MSDPAQTLPAASAADPMMDGTTASDAGTLCTVGALTSALQQMEERMHASMQQMEERTQASMQQREERMHASMQLMEGRTHASMQRMEELLQLQQQEQGTAAAPHGMPVL
eukprot:GHVU01197126.1.p2 GENE.GHVU01197126.1~~GHVU01197126.1.p2  ORF type:complete len:110 (-),score=28.67 GHVU01197126.1:71-400(-)